MFPFSQRPVGQIGGFPVANIGDFGVPVALDGDFGVTVADDGDFQFRVACMSDFDVAIVGGGISGLACAHYLSKNRADLKICVFEGANRVGGKIGSAEIMGQRIDTGPDAFLARVKGGVELCNELGLDLVAPATGQAYLAIDGELKPLPTGLVLGVPSNAKSLSESNILSEAGLERALAGSQTRIESGDISVAAGIAHHFGQEVVDRLVDPLIGGICAGDTSTLSLKSISPDLFEAVSAENLMEELGLRALVTKRGSIGVSEQNPVFLTPRSGISSLIESLRVELESKLNVNTLVTSVEKSDGEWKLRSKDQTFSAKMLVLATPAHISAQLLGDGDLSLELASIRTSSVCLTLLIYPKSAVSLPPGSGFLVPRSQGKFVTAVSWWSQKWPHLDLGEHIIIRVSCGRDGDVRFQSMSDSEIVEAKHRELKDILGVECNPVSSVVSRWDQGFAQYDVGHGDKVDQIMTLAREEDVHLIGASYRGVGLPACVRGAVACAQELASL